MNQVENKHKEYFDILDSMQNEGTVNMFDAPRILREMFDVGKRESIDITSAWMKSKTVRRFIKSTSNKQPKLIGT